jgi:hypothetical protein
LLEHAGDEELPGKVDVEMSVKLFLMVVLDKLLLSRIANHVDADVISAVHELGNFGCVDWCSIVYKRLELCVSRWKSGKRGQIAGCLYLPVVSTY